MSFESAVDIEEVQTLNLKSFDLQVPARTLTALTGTSGAGKTALLVHTIWAESRRQHMESEARQSAFVVPPRIGRVNVILPSINLTSVVSTLPPRVTVARFLALDHMVKGLFAKYARLSCGVDGCGIFDAEATRKRLVELDRDLFLGARRTTEGMKAEEVERVVFEGLKSGSKRFLINGQWVELRGEDPNLMQKIPSSQSEVITIFEFLSSKHLDASRFAEAFRVADFLGSNSLEIYIAPDGNERKTIDHSWQHMRAFAEGACALCGSPANASTSASGRLISHRLFGKEEGDLLRAPAEELAKVVDRLVEVDSSDKALLENSVDILVRLGLAELNLSQKLQTISSGERLKLVAAYVELLRLTDTLLLIDEPSRLVHGADFQQILFWSRRMLKEGNTVIFAERVSPWLKEFDRVIELGGPENRNSGELVADLQGGALTLAPPKPRVQASHEAERFLEVDLALGAHAFALPLERLLALVGPTGSGKTRLLNSIRAALASQRRRLPWGRVLYFDEAELNDRSGAGRTLADILGVSESLAKMFSSLPLARRQGLKVSDFRIPLGTSLCESCGGSGVKQRLEGLGEEVCDYCAGRRFAPHILQILFRERNIVELLEVSLARALSEFPSEESLAKILSEALKFGLGEVPLNTKTSALGNALLTRALLARELSKDKKKSLLVLLDQPFAGLDEPDIEAILFLLRQECAAGNTFVYSTHQASAIGLSDYVCVLSRAGAIEFFDRADKFSSNSYV